MPRALDGDWWSTPCPSPFTPGKTWYSLCTSLGGLRGQSGWVPKKSEHHQLLNPKPSSP